MRVENVKGAVWTVDELEFYKRRPQRCTSSSTSAAAANAVAAIAISGTSSTSPPSTTMAAALASSNMSGRDMCHSGTGIPGLHHPFGPAGPYDGGALLEQLYLPENLAKISGYGSSMAMQSKAKKRLSDFHSEKQRRYKGHSTHQDDMEDDPDRDQSTPKNMVAISPAAITAAGDQNTSTTSSFVNQQAHSRAVTSAAHDRYVGCQSLSLSLSLLSILLPTTSSNPKTTPKRLPRRLLFFSVLFDFLLTKQILKSLSFFYLLRLLILVTGQPFPFRSHAIWSSSSSFYSC